MNFRILVKVSEYFQLIGDATSFMFEEKDNEKR